MVLASTCARWAEAVSKASGEGQEAAGARVHLVSTLARRSVPSPSTATLAARLPGCGTRCAIHGGYFQPAGGECFGFR
eukprot:COSAG01_NODE_4612_length_4878_cov_15.581502_6_plen_78_part_00